MPKSRRHFRITLSHALSAHEEALKQGGRPGIHSLDLIESAIARPYSGYYRSMAEKAAALVHSMASNHGFSDGNKRTTLILLNLLLRKSGYELLPHDLEQLNFDSENLILDVVEHRMDHLDLVEWFKSRLARKS